MRSWADEVNRTALAERVSSWNRGPAARRPHVTFLQRRRQGVAHTHSFAPIPLPQFPGQLVAPPPCLPASPPAPDRCPDPDREARKRAGGKGMGAVEVGSSSGGKGIGAKEYPENRFASRAGLNHLHGAK